MLYVEDSIHGLRADLRQNRGELPALEGTLTDGSTHTTLFRVSR
jgi:hypothetical protein